MNMDRSPGPNGEWGVLPREVAPGIVWLGRCGNERFDPRPGKIVHSYNSPWLVVGDRHTLLVDTGFPFDRPVIDEQIDALLATGIPPLRYVFPTHQETPHGGGVGWLLAKYPDAVAVGSTHDLHLCFPEIDEARFLPSRPGDVIDLGGTEFRVIEPAIQDLRTTLWGFDTRRKALFASDGFGTLHYHEDHHCGMFAEDAVSLDLTLNTEFFAEGALFWMRFTKMQRYADRLEKLCRDLDVAFVCPAHGLPVRDFNTTFPRVRTGLIQVGL